ncbi:EARP and GARP complex-interacting protein 1 [Galemys pyrenaicus]|uniref:EARP and GARP complex-interacting protein 1 n=1 Tax=Galemys pyrenaicus TaxID=202257 RepID=A0A8J6A828_GALPY|nr:EARP and GARP complex-interacting protein 1 [Galemys pyrenaicus]
MATPVVCLARGARTAHGLKPQGAGQHSTPASLARHRRWRNLVSSVWKPHAMKSAVSMRLSASGSVAGMEASVRDELTLQWLFPGQRVAQPAGSAPSPSERTHQEPGEAGCSLRASDSRVLTCAAVWRMPKGLEPGSHESPDDSSSTAHTLELLCHLDNAAHGSSACVMWEPTGDGKKVISLADNHILLWDLQESSSQAPVSDQPSALVPLSASS